MMAAGLRATAKAVEHPPEPKIGAPVLDPTATLVVAFLTIILVNRSWTRTILSTIRAPNAALWWVVTGAGLLLRA